MTRPARLLGDDGVRVFLFHGVVAQPREGVRNYTGKHIPLSEFSAIMRELRDAGTPVSMDEVAALCRGEAELPPRAFAVTFDDGFANNATVAAPALADLGVPATFYVTTGFVEHGTGSWTDMIEAAVEQVADVRLRLPFLDARATTREEKIAILEAIRAHVKEDPALDPYAVAAEVWSQLGVREVERDEQLDGKLSWAQVRQLAADDLFDVGGHGLTHRILGRLDAEELEREVGESLAALRAHVAAPVTHFSYPEGLPSSYSDAVVDRLRAHGISCAVVVEPRPVHRGDDPFRVSRYLVA